MGEAQAVWFRRGVVWGFAIHIVWSLAIHIAKDCAIHIIWSFAILSLPPMGEVGGGFHSHHHIVAVSGMVGCDEAVFSKVSPYYKFWLHTVWTYGSCGEVFFFAAHGATVSVDIDRHCAVGYSRHEPVDAVEQARQFVFVVIHRHIEHILLRQEAERVNRVGPGVALCCNRRKRCRNE